MMKKLNLILLFVATMCPQLFSQVKWTLSTEDEQWVEKSPLTLNENAGDSEYTITIDPSTRLQKIDGFGGSFNERGMDALNVLSDEKRQEVMAQLFDANVGCAFNIGRMPMGASDYSMDYFSYNDVANDFKMKHFSIKRDRKYLIPYMKLALQHNPDLRVWGSPWTPPAWMKESGHYACQGLKEKSHLIWEPKVLKSYALYFKKYLQAYKNEGIDIYAVHVQNEPYACQNFPSCLWNGEQLSDFIKNYLGPELENLNVEIWLGTINNRNYNDYAGVVLSDPQTKKYITGVGYQWSGKHAIGQTAIEHPDMKLMQTESECGGNENNMSSAVKTFGLIDHYLKAGANSYMYWNMVLDNSGLSTWGWPQNSMISIDRATREPKYNMEFYVMKHFSHFVKKDAHRLATTGCDENTLAFQNPDNEIIIVVMNDSHNDMKYTIEVEGKMFELMVPSGSFNTFQIN